MLHPLHNSNNQISASPFEIRIQTSPLLDLIKFLASFVYPSNLFGLPSLISTSIAFLSNSLYEKHCLCPNRVLHVACPQDTFVGIFSNEE